MSTKPSTILQGSKLEIYDSFLPGLLRGDIQPVRHNIRVALMNKEYIPDYGRDTSYQAIRRYRVPDVEPAVLRGTMAARTRFDGGVAFYVLSPVWFGPFVSTCDPRTIVLYDEQCLTDNLIGWAHVTDRNGEWVRLLPGDRLTVDWQDKAVFEISVSDRDEP